MQTADGSALCTLFSRYCLNVGIFLKIKQLETVFQKHCFCIVKAIVLHSERITFAS